MKIISLVLLLLLNINAIGAEQTSDGIYVRAQDTEPRVMSIDGQDMYLGG